jgi:all-trans-retinol dehydrogenase (NAD+)
VRLELWRDNVKTIRTLLVCPAAVDTGMFAGALAGDHWALKISRFFIPMLPESEVVDAIYRSMRRGDELLVSCFSGWRGVVLSWAPVVSRLLPVSLYDVVVSLGGGLHGMDTFVGKTPTRDKEKVK